MKKFLYRMLMVLAVAAGVLLIAGETPVSAAAKLNKTEVTIEIGERKKVKVKGTTKTVKWKSSDKSIATVTKRGNIDAKAKGECIVTATVGKKKLKCKVTVTDTIGDLLDKEVVHEGVSLKVSSNWELVKDMADEGYYPYDIDKNTFKIITLELSEENEKDYNIRTASEEQYLKTVKSFARTYKRDYDLQDIEYTVIKPADEYIGRITGTIKSGDKTIFNVIYVKLTKAKIIIVSGMDYDKLTDSTDKIAERVCREAKLVETKTEEKTKEKTKENTEQNTEEKQQ
ncbi:MAG: Ig-like domain-containing protein [Lachnospiraceae bacterium]|nr:Ig-like domain-containing protein [Lachnospiraceae bacterium]